MRDKVSCEKGCGCSADCSRRFPGCDCGLVGEGCAHDFNCLCFFWDRECDPDLCKSCQSEKALTLDAGRRHQHCRNVSLQRGAQKRTFTGTSQIKGFGLFAGEDLKADDFLGEYKGEIIPRPEVDRRAEIYNATGQFYFFTLNCNLEVDGTNASNKFRFANHKDAPNIWARTMLCNMVNRIGLWAKRDIAVGEELFLDYGESFKRKMGDRMVVVDDADPVRPRKKKRKTFAEGRKAGVARKTANTGKHVLRESIEKARPASEEGTSDDSKWAPLLAGSESTTTEEEDEDMMDVREVATGLRRSSRPKRGA